MSSEPVLSVLFLWHQHQPFYKDPLSNRYEMPWVRLHAIKDYYDMVALLDEFPQIRSNFNLVPSLLVQLDDYAQGKGVDHFLELTLKPAEDLSIEDKTFLLGHFFMANWENMVDPHPRYRELLDKRGRSASGHDFARIQSYFKEQDWRDLQMWFNLAWFDPYWVERDPLIQNLTAKDRGYTEEDKQALIDKQREICGKVAAKHKELMDRGQIEITATPFYHPILPLLADTDSARMAMPQVVLPQERFSHIEDARTQIEKALADHEHRFGRRPQGMWPSEGSVSEAVADLMVEAGVRWIATDEAILARSIQPADFARDDIYEPYTLYRGGKPLHFFFRDHELSDAIGFVYTGWKSTDAVNDFIRRLHDIRERLKKRDANNPRPHVVSVILDGENCWEYYKEDGLPFLRELYARLSAEPLLRTVRASDYLDQTPPQRQLDKLSAGSWIYGNFGIWIGHREDNLAWDFVSRTRNFLVRRLAQKPELAESDAAKLAWEEMYIAEGSDWCWWYGDDHSSANDALFDYLFRKHLMNVYTLMGETPPQDLLLPIKLPRSSAPVTPPVDFVTPQIDGRITSYFEWQAAGFYETEAGKTGTMHRAQNIVKAIYFGFDLQNLYFRIDLGRPLEADALQNVRFRLVFLRPENTELWITLPGLNEVALQLRTFAPERLIDLPPGAARKIIEFALPLKHLPASPGQSLEALLHVDRDGLEQERWPAATPLSIPYPRPEAFAESWIL